MAAIGCIGRSASRPLRTCAVGAVDSVVERIIDLGLSSSVTLHGSAATGDYAFLDCGDSPALMSDIDILVNDSHVAPYVASIENELSHVFRVALGKLASPASKVSIKVINGGFLRTMEAPSLLRSAVARGCQTRQLTRTNPYNMTGAIVFPYALPYAVWRTITHLGTGRAENAVALYELTKGCWRAKFPQADGQPLGARVLALDECRSVVETSLFSLRSFVPPTTSRILADWLASPDLLRLTLGPSRLLQQRSEISRVVMRRMPHGLLNDRIRATLAVGAAA